MKNVYHDIELENDSAEGLEETGDLAQFKGVEQAPKKRRVEYDEKGRVRKDYSNFWIKMGILVIAVVLVNLYVFHMCGADLAQIF
ncbi:MAG: hypothetical protein IJG57_01345 [Firmicutes bacterium]|jgi:hypothetical protein|nr:hypothetical protein [Bacillota bacterium]